MTRQTAQLGSRNAGWPSITNLSQRRVGRLAELPIPHAAQPVFLVSLSEAIRLVRQRADGLGLVLPELGQWGAALEAYLAETKVRREREARPWAKAA